MANNIFVCSDHHLGHKNIITFKDYNGNLIRPFSSMEEMHDIIIERHNKVVRPQDKVYYLGDVATNKGGLELLKYMNGHKRLVRGNHDIFKLKDYKSYFEEIYGVRVFADYGMVLTHIPIHKECMSRWKLNIHGHLHANIIKDSQYLNVSLERIDYTPVSIEEIRCNM